MTLLAQTPAAPALPGSALEGLRARLALPQHLVVPALLGAVGGVVLFPLALLVTGSPVVAGGAALGVLLTALAFADPLLALVVLAGVEVSQTGPVLVALGVPSPLVVTQALAVGALGVALLRGTLRVPWSPVLLAGLVLVGTRAATAFTSLDPATTLAITQGELRDLLTLFVAYALLVHTRGASATLRVCVGVLAALALLSGVQEYLLGNSTEFLGFSQANPPDVGASSFRHSGPVGDPNFWGRVLLMFLPFGLALALGAADRLARLVWWSASASVLLGIFLTQSRGAFLAAAAAVVVLLLLAGWQYARWLALTPLLVVLLLALPGIGTRLSTLADLGESAEGGGDLSLVLRLASQEAGLRMLSEHPWLGVGAGTYEELTPRFERGLTFATVGELGKPLAPHNAFLEYAAEGGLVGALGLTFFLGTLTFCGWRAWRTAGRRVPAGRRNREQLLAAACLAALAGWAVASVVLHARQFRTLLVLAAVVGALDALRGPLGPPRSTAPLPLRRLARPWVGLGVLAALGGLLLLGPLDARQERWQASAVSVVAARGTSGGGLDAYHYDLLTRGQVVPTFAGVLESRSVVARSLQDAGLPLDAVGVEVEVVTRPRSGDLLVRVRADDATQARAVAQQMATVGARAVDRLGTPFVLQSVPFSEVVARRVQTLDLRLLLAVGGWVVLAAVVAWLQLQLLHRRRVRAQA